MEKRIRISLLETADDRVWLTALWRQEWAGEIMVTRGQVYRLAAVHAGAIDEARRLKPSIPLIGSHGIPLHDELELEKRM